MNYVVCHYHEIGLKGKNRKFFEEKLVQNIKKSLNSDFYEFVKRISGRVIIRLSKKGQQNQKDVEKSLKRVFGLSSFSFAVHSEQEIQKIKKKAKELMEKKNFNTFRVSARRAEKNFPFTSQQINEKVGAEIVKKLKKKVNLEKPGLTCFIEIVEKYAFLYLKKIKGLGGLPQGVSGKALALISGGIDSPVSAFQIMKRGVKVIFVHFHSHPYTDEVSIKKTEKIIKILNNYQQSSELYLVPFADLQKEILLKTPSKLRMILYRRFMLRISEEIAKKQKAQALVTGESIGQVASQTLENIKVIEEVVNLPLFRPLIGKDKEEIISLAKKIGTFETSILPHQDCCARFLPLYPATKADLKEVKDSEKKLDVKKLVKEALKNTETRRVL